MQLQSSNALEREVLEIRQGWRRDWRRDEVRREIRVTMSLGMERKEGLERG